jgi:hypothetical protein
VQIPQLVGFVKSFDISLRPDDLVLKNRALRHSRLNAGAAKFAGRIDRSALVRPTTPPPLLYNNSI